jgi:hypothetical protein
MYVTPVQIGEKKKVPRKRKDLRSDINRGRKKKVPRKKKGQHMKIIFDTETRTFAVADKRTFWQKHKGKILAGAALAGLGGLAYANKEAIGDAVTKFRRGVAAPMSDGVIVDAPKATGEEVQSPNAKTKGVQDNKEGGVHIPPECIRATKTRSYPDWLSKKGLEAYNLMWFGSMPWNINTAKELTEFLAANTFPKKEADFLQGVLDAFIVDMRADRVKFAEHLPYFEKSKIIAHG